MIIDIYIDVIYNLLPTDWNVRRVSMSRVSREQSELHRFAIEEASSRLMRERGITGVSVADVMASVGLTHGGFYGHFPSKDALTAIACANAFAQSTVKWKNRVKDNPDRAAALASIVDNYLSAKSRNSAGTGCPLSALATDVAREPADKPVRDAFLTGLNNLVEILVDLQGTGNSDRDRALALSQLAMMVGGLVLARATQGAKISDEILAATREHLIPKTRASKR
jgi:TetR/AcrR family transcriptional repressor of nem operon